MQFGRGQFFKNRKSLFKEGFNEFTFRFVVGIDTVDKEFVDLTAEVPAVLPWQFANEAELPYWEMIALITEFVSVYNSFNPDQKLELSIHSGEDQACTEHTVTYRIIVLF
jgi:hypothetical protein